MIGEKTATRRKPLTLLLVLGVLALLTVNIGVASAHWWSTGPSFFHFHKSTVGVWLWGTHQAEANAARYDWSRNTDLYVPRRSYHTDVSVYGSNSGNTGWGGLATITSSGWRWHCGWWCNVNHAHAQYNSYYGGSTGTGSGSDVRGVFCQEIGHTFGLDHSNTGDCMGKGYYNGVNVTGPHNWADINALY